MGLLPDKVYLPMSNPYENIDFDEWMKLAKQDPEQFEAKRIQHIEEIIKQSPPEYQQRLRQLQWQVDGVRRSSGSPLGACIKISRLMFDSLLKQQQLFNEIHDLANGNSPATPKVRTATDNVLMLPTQKEATSDESNS